MIATGSRILLDDIGWWAVIPIALALLILFVGVLALVGHFTGSERDR